jgi:hypothetical protein
MAITNGIVTNISAERVLDWVAKAVIGLLILVSGWTIDRIGSVEAAADQNNDRLTRIESNRFTGTDANALEEELRLEMNQKLDRIITCLNRIQQGRTCD